MDRIEMTKIVESMDMTVAPPEKEPERQYYFISKSVKHWMAEDKKRELGRPLTCVCDNLRLSDECERFREAVWYSGEDRLRGRRIRRIRRFCAFTIPVPSVKMPT